MIHRLRKRHRRASLALAVLLPIGLAATLLGRTGSAGTEIQSRGFEAGSLTFGDYELQCLVRATNGVLTVELWPETSLAFPDLLLYWGPEKVGAQLSGDEVLLGSFQPNTPQVFELPAAASVGGTLADGPRGSLALFSLAHGELVGAAELAAYEVEGLEVD